MRLILLLLIVLCPPLLADQARPNIIVFYTDDHGFADLGVHGVEKDVRTPHIDSLARGGVIVRHGYSTAPQCVPSRGGLLTGKFQGRFGLDSNNSPLDGFNKETTIATRLRRAGYVTAQFGKWHLGPPSAIVQHGFKHVFAQHGRQTFAANITAEGEDCPMGDHASKLYHVDGCSQAAAAIVRRYSDEPFFLYIAFRAPHTPLDAPKHYIDRFPGAMPERRRAALAMLSAVDDGVGLITTALKTLGLTEKTLIFFIADNGAPLKIHKIDSPLNGDAGGWDGSLNTPLNGEKGMLSEGGMHVPFIVAWPGTIPAGQVYEHPISALDVAATAAAVAEVPTQPGDLDGVNLIPYLKGERSTPPHEALMWRWMAQSAIREGNWKLLRGGEREYLYDLAADLREKHNLASQEPEIASRLRARLTAWCANLNPPGLALGPMAPTWNDYFDFYLDGKPAARLDAQSQPRERPGPTQGWLARGGSLTEKDGLLVLTPDKAARGCFIVRNSLQLRAPASASVTLKTAVPGPAAVAWRTEGEKDFSPENRASFDIQPTTQWQSHEIPLTANGVIVHVRVHLPGAAEIREIDFRAAGK